MSLIRWFNQFRNKQSVKEKQIITKRHLTNLITETFESLVKAHNKGTKLIYDNQFGLTSGQVLDGLGKDQAEILRLMMLIKECVNLAVPGTIGNTDEYGCGHEK